MTTITKTIRDGWQAEDELPLEKLADGGERTLRVCTYKGSRGVVTSISAGVNRTDGFRETVIMQDYSARIPHGDIKRATEKTIGEAHARAMGMVHEYVNQAKKQYGIA